MSEEVTQGARDAAWALEQAYEGEKRDHENTKVRAEKAEHRLYLMQHRMAWLMGLHDDPDGDYYTTFERESGS